MASADQAGLAEACSARVVHLYVCALGPVQSGDGVDPGAVERDLALVERVLAASAGRPVHVVLVSSVIALAPGADRRFYGGWKGVVEQRLGRLVGAHPRASFSVLYPGRLVAGSRALPNTSYRGLARRLEAAATGSSRSRVVGVDARVWLLLRAVSLTLQGVTGRSSTSHRDSSGEG
jgi:hypothetical protein